MPPATRRPVHGYPVRVVLPDRSLVVWWGTDEDDDDVLAADGDRVLVWPDLETCLDDARGRGWSEAAPDDAPDELDVRAAAAWLTGARDDLDPVSALAAWNLADDVAASTGSVWDGEDDPLDDACHEKLTFANVPWLIGLDEYVPAWTDGELAALRRRLDAALALIAGALAG